MHASEGSIDIVACGCPPAGLAVGLWDGRCGFSSSHDAYRTRDAEHRQVCTELGVPTFDLGITDRDYVVAGRDGSGDAWKRLRAACPDGIPPVIVTHRLDAPHPDHRATAHFVQAFAQQQRKTAIAVCDRPYLTCASGHDTLSAGPATLSILLTDEQWKRKRRLVGLYSSQRGALAATFGADWQSRGRLGRECYAALDG